MKLIARKYFDLKSLYEKYENMNHIFLRGKRMGGREENADSFYCNPRVARATAKFVCIFLSFSSTLRK